jgi:ubiquitin carboxyl-terminal hydrolase 1
MDARAPYQRRPDYASYDPRLQRETTPPSAGASIAYSLVAIYIVHQLLVSFDYPLLSLPELAWNALVFVVPARLILTAAKRHELRANDMLSQTHAAKSEALRRMLGVGGATLTHRLTGGEGIMRKMSGFAGGEVLGGGMGMEVMSDAPPGLGNWDNSCYQNSVLQGLAALQPLKSYLAKTTLADGDGEADTTRASLRETIAKLSDAGNNGRHLWAPAKLKSMSSWQQQDAQEYFSKIMDELDKEAVAARKKVDGLEVLAQGAEGKAEESDEAKDQVLHNPMEGMLAQKVACTRCGFSEGISMIPFNCLTVPLGSDYEYDVRDCLDEYTKLEEISDVECAKCTLLRAESQLKQMAEPSKGVLPSTPETVKQSLSLPPELRAMVAKRLQAIQEALDSDDFSDKMLSETCQIPKRGRVSSTKTRQAVIGRAPQSLVVHVNRSVFDELTGVQRKNYAAVRYPLLLDLGYWVLSGQHLSAGATTAPLLNASCDGKESATGPFYRLKAVVTHYGRHENGHYICYREHPVRPQDGADKVEGEMKGKREMKWWRLSDEDVSEVSENDVLGQQGVFMLFYEREEAADDGRRDQEDALVVTATTEERTAALVANDQAVLEQAINLALPPDDQDKADFAPVEEAALPTVQQPSAEHEPIPESISQASPASAPLPSRLITQESSEDQHSSTETASSTTTEDEADEDPVAAALLTERSNQPPSPPVTMRTARGAPLPPAGRKESLGSHAASGNNVFRAMAAT